MINNNPYNIPERPLKQKKIVIETSPLYPHQINRSQEEEYRHRFPHQKKQTTPYFIQSTVTQVSRIPVSPQQPFKPQALQMSTVTQWDGLQSNHTTYHIGELNEKIAAITQKLDAHEKKITFLIDSQKQEHLSSRKQDPISTNLSQSASFSMQILSMNGSKQMERYHSTEETWDKIRQEFISYRSQSERLGENLRAQLHEQKNNITRELINNFKDSLKEKFDQEEIKIADYLSEFTQNEKTQLDRAVEELKREMRDYLQAQLLAIKKKDHLNQSRSESEIKVLREKLQNFTEIFDEFQSSHRSFKEEVMDNVLATQDHKRWLYEIEQRITEFQHNLNKLDEDRVVEGGTLKVSKEYCIKETMHLRYEEYLSIAGSSMPSIQTSEKTYLIDDQGFLLDGNRFYLIDSSNNRIRLSEGQVAQLKSLNLLK